MLDSNLTIGDAKARTRRCTEWRPHHARDTIDDALGRRKSTGNAADDMLNSVEDAIRGRM